MPKNRSFRILELCVFLKEHAQLEDNFVQIFLFGIIVRSEGLNGLVILINRVVLFIVLEFDPALTKKLLAERSIEHYEVLDPADNFF